MGRSSCAWGALAQRALLLLFAGVASVGLASGGEADAAVRLGVFGTLGGVYNDSDRVEFVRDLSQPSGPKGGWSSEPDTSLGIQVNLRHSQQLEAALQLLSRYDYTSNYDPRITWAFAKYSPDPHWQLRVGRIGYDAFILSDSANVGYAFLPVRQPIEYFGTLALAHLDGGDAEYRSPVGAGVFSVKLFAGRADEELDVGNNEQYDLKDSRVVGFNLNYHLGAWYFRLGGSEIELSQELDSFEGLLAGLRASGSAAAASVADDIALDGSRVVNWNAAVVFDRGALQAQLLYNKRQTDTLAFADGAAIYGLLGYRMGAFTPYMAVVDGDAEFARRDTGLPSSHPLSVAAERVFREALFEQRTVMVGVRYDFMPKADLKIQLERLEANSSSTSFMRSADPDWGGEATIVSVALDFIF